MATEPQGFIRRNHEGGTADPTLRRHLDLLEKCLVSTLLKYKIHLISASLEVRYIESK